MILMIQPRPAAFTEKQNGYSVQKNGYITFDFCPLLEDQRSLNIEAKKTFILTMQNVGDLLDLDTRTNYNQQIDSEGRFI
mmetsp:Transcript_26264/g.25443  ORF Transcript_26264/g.25443 Transcript_26264/m.25443 type:complete len:80 (+) Transcript_26264:275-514(+)